MYFVKITASWRAANSLLKYVESKVQAVEKTTVEDPQQVFDYLNAHFALANHTYNRCKSEKVTMRTAYNNDDVLIESSIFQITLYKMGGNFAPVSVATAKRSNPSSGASTGQKLSLF